MIYPSMKIDVPVENIQKLDARINFMMNIVPRLQRIKKVYRT